MNKIKNPLILTPGYLRQSWKQVLIVHLSFTALGFVLFAPLIGFTGQLLLSLSGQPALSDQDIVYFLLSPIGMLALILFAALLMGVLTFEQTALMRIAINVMQRQRIGTVNAFLYTAARINKLFLYAARLITRVLALTLPFLAIAAGIAFLLISNHDINYYLKEQPSEFWTAAVLIGVVLVTMLVVLVRKLLDWSLALPLLLFGDVTPSKSFGESARITQGKRGQILAVFAVWAGLLILLNIAVLGAVKLLGSWIVPGVSESITLLAILLGVLSALWMLCNFLITYLTSGSLAYLVMGFYEQYGPGYNAELTKGNRKDARLRKFHLTLPKITVALIAGVTVAGFTGIWLIKDIQDDDEVTIIAHRGAAGKTPENTLAAVYQAIEDKTDWIEIDVQETADGEVVVIHDSDFMKLAGKNIKIQDATLAQIREIDIGSWFDPRFSQERTPTLKEVLEAARGKARVVIELKYYGHDKKLEQRVVDIVEKTDMVNEIAIMSLNYNAIRKVRALRPNWTIGLLSATSLGHLARLDADFLAVAMRMATGQFIRRAHKAGKQVFVWTVNDPASMSRMISLGVDGIITDEPELARRVLEVRTELSPVERLLINTELLFGQSLKSHQYRDESP